MDASHLLLGYHLVPLFPEVTVVSLLRVGEPAKLISKRGAVIYSHPSMSGGVHTVVELVRLVRITMTSTENSSFQADRYNNFKIEISVDTGLSYRRNFLRQWQIQQIPIVIILV